MKTLYKKELQYYLNTPVGYIIIFLFGVFANFLFVKDIFVVGSASLRPFFSLIPWLFVIFIPALSMRSLSEEKRSNTLETLLTLPISESQIILSKFLALLTVVTLGLLLTSGLPISLSIMANLYFPEVLSGYVGILFLAALFICISMFFSSLNKNQVVAFLSSVVVLFLLLVISSEFTASTLPKFIQDVLVYYSPLYHFENFTKGIIDIRSVFYFLSGIVLFLFLTITDLERRS